VQLKHTLVASQAMQTIHVLGNQSEVRKAGLHIGQRDMRRVGLAGADEPTPPSVPLPNQIRIPSEGARRGQFFRPILTPQALFAPKGRYATFGGDAGSGQDGYALKLGEVYGVSHWVQDLACRRQSRVKYSPGDLAP